MRERNVLENPSFFKIFSFQEQQEIRVILLIYWDSTAATHFSISPVVGFVFLAGVASVGLMFHVGSEIGPEFCRNSTKQHESSPELQTAEENKAAAV